MHGAPVPKVDLVSRAGIGTGFPAGFVPRCLKCRYDLTGLKRSRCPECGTAFAIPELIAVWKARNRKLKASDADVIAAGLLSFAAIVPTNLEILTQFFWKVPVLLALWMLVIVSYGRRAEELREPHEGHRLLWVWVPCIVTVVGVAPTPWLNLVAAGVLLALGVGATVVAWRRAPGPTVSALTVTVAAPAAAVVLLAGALVVGALGGERLGSYWSAADYPSWYWAGVPGRARGISNESAVRIGGVALVLGVLTLAAIVGMWAMLTRGRVTGRGAESGDGVARRRVVLK